MANTAKIRLTFQSQMNWEQFLEYVNSLVIPPTAAVEIGNEGNDEYIQATWPLLPKGVEDKKLRAEQSLKKITGVTLTEHDGGPA